MLKKSNDNECNLIFKTPNEQFQISDLLFDFLPSSSFCELVTNTELQFQTHSITDEYIVLWKEKLGTGITGPVR